MRFFFTFKVRVRGAGALFKFILVRVRGAGAVFLFNVVRVRVRVRFLISIFFGPWCGCGFFHDSCVRVRNRTRTRTSESG